MLDASKNENAPARRWWPVVKTVLGVAVLALIAWQFARDLGRLPPRTEPVRVGWLAGSAGLYLVGLGLSGVYWVSLLRHLGAAPGWLRGLRAYFVSQLGKYVPGKAMALVMRVGMVRGPGTPASTAALTAFYEVLTTMAAGVLLALVLIPFVVPGDVPGVLFSGWLRLDLGPHSLFTRYLVELLLFAGLLFLACAAPLTPWLFNRLATGVTRRFGLTTPPPVRYAYFLEGLLVIAPCWVLFGLSLACGLAALPEVDGFWSWGEVGWLMVCIALAYVGGFVVPISPGGLGVREFLLVLLLVPLLTRNGMPATEAAAVVTLVVLLLRLAWTVGEVALAGCLYVASPSPRGAS